MKSIETTGKTLELAIEDALTKLNVPKDRTKVEVLDEASKGFFGIGSRLAKVRVTLCEDPLEDATEFLRNVFNKMGIDIKIEASLKSNTIKIHLEGEKIGLLIGYRGETLDSLQYLTSLVVNKSEEGKYKKIILNASNYREKREEKLRYLAKKMAYKVAKIKKPFKFEPMNPYERRIIHSALQNDKFVKTYSEGEEPNRRIVIDLK